MDETARSADGSTETVTGALFGKVGSVSVVVALPVFVTEGSAPACTCVRNESVTELPAAIVPGLAVIVEPVTLKEIPGGTEVKPPA
jgi:hypothetical protein